MSLMHIKNKYEVAFRQMIKECSDKHAIPDFIEISPKEAWEILLEMQHTGSRDTSFKVEDLRSTNNFLQTDFHFTIFGRSTVDEKTARELITEWIKGNMGVSFRQVPLKVIFKPRKKVEDSNK